MSNDYFMLSGNGNTVDNILDKVKVIVVVVLVVSLSNPGVTSMSPKSYEEQRKGPSAVDTDNILLHAQT